METAETERAIRLRARSNFEWFAEKCLRIAVKEPGAADAIKALELNDAQEYIHARIEAQERQLGRVRAIILKGRQQGVSTYTEGRFYWKVIHRSGVGAYILTHKQDATDNLFDMVERYHKNCPPLFRPHVGRSNQKELEFDRLDSRYTVATAGAKGAGRSRTIHFFHGSEVGYWEHAKGHMAGALQAVPDADGTEIILESTANGTSDTGAEFYRLCMEALGENSDFMLLFVPWFWQREYRASVPDGFLLSDDRADVPEGELTEYEYANVYRLKPAQMMWRRKKISELDYWAFKREYPASVAEAFQASGEASLIPINLLVKARKFKAPAFGSLVIGMDPAHRGEDATAIIRRKGRKAWGAQLFHKLSVPQAAGVAARIIRHERPKYFFIDVGGVGAGIADLLLESPAVPKGVVVPVNFGGRESVIEPERFLNKKAEIYWLAKEWFEDPAGVEVPDSDQLQAEATVSRYTFDASQRLKIESKEELRRRGVASPDLFDALALTFAYPVAGDDLLAEVQKDIEAGWPAEHFGLRTEAVVDDYGGWSAID